MEHRDHFNVLYEKHYNSLSKKNQKYFTIDAETYQKIFDTLKLDKGVASVFGKEFKYWVNDYFKIVTIGTLDYVYSRDTDLPVAKHEDIFDIILW